MPSVPYSNETFALLPLGSTNPFTCARVVDSAVAPDMVALHGEAEALKEELHAALEADELNVDEIEALRAEAVGVFDRGTSLALESFVELHGTLTPEQRDQIRDRLQADGGHGRGHGCPHGTTPEQAE